MPSAKTGKGAVGALFGVWLRVDGHDLDIGRRVEVIVVLFQLDADLELDGGWFVALGCGMGHVRKVAGLAGPAAEIGAAASGHDDSNSGGNRRDSGLPDRSALRHSREVTESWVIFGKLRHIRKTTSNRESWYFRRRRVVLGWCGVLVL